MMTLIALKISRPFPLLSQNRMVSYMENWLNHILMDDHWMLSSLKGQESSDSEP